MIFEGALFVEDRKIRLKNWSSQRSFIHSSSLVAVYAVNTSFQNKPIDPRVPRQSLHLWNSCERPSYFFLFPPFFACIRVRHAYHAVYMLFYADVMNVHRARQEYLSIFSRAMRKEESYHDDEKFPFPLQLCEIFEFIFEI